MDNEASLDELITSLNNSITDMREHPIKVDRLPSNFEIILKGVTNSSAIDFLFSDKMNSTIEALFKAIETGNFDTIINSKDKAQELMDTMFGKGSFQGPVSQTVLNSIQGTMNSYRYQTMKSHLGKTMTTLKKIKLIMKNLNKAKKSLKGDKEQYKKCKDAIYAIKQILKFVARVYRNRKIINRRVYDGLNNIVHEDAYYEFDEALE